MRTKYSDDDTERAREVERSSAGRQTQPLGLPPAAPALPTRSRGQGALGVALIVLGALMLLGYLASNLVGGVAGPLLPDGGDLRAGMILLTIGSCFLFFGFWQRIYGLIIPGCILAGLSVGVPFADLTHGVSVLWGLSLGFLSIMLLSRGLFGIRESWARWPMIPAVILFAVGTLVAISNLPSFLFGGVVMIPLLLIAAGLYLGWSRRAP